MILETFLVELFVAYGALSVEFLAFFVGEANAHYAMVVCCIGNGGGWRGACLWFFSIKVEAKAFEKLGNFMNAKLKTNCRRAS